MSKFKSGDIVWVPYYDYSDYGKDEEYWTIEQCKLKAVQANGHCVIDKNTLRSSINTTFKTLEEAKKYIKDYLIKNYGHKWKNSYLEKILTRAYKNVKYIK